MPSAGTRSGTAWRRQPNITSGSIWPMTWREATGAGFGAFRMRALGRRHGERLERARIVGDLRGDDAAQAEHGVGRGVGERHVDAAARGGRRAGVVDMDAAVGDGQRGLERHRLVVAVDRHLVVPGALGQLGDLGQHGLARAGDDVLGRAGRACRCRTRPSSRPGGARRRRCRRPASRRRPRCRPAGACWRGSSPSGSRSPCPGRTASASGCRGLP